MSLLFLRSCVAVSFVVLAAVSCLGCGDDDNLTKNPAPGDSDTASGTEDAGTQSADTAATDSETGTSSATESGATDTTPRPVDTEGDTPPTLEARCTLAIPATSASEPLDDLHPGAKGDAQAPSIAPIPGGAALAWDYLGLEDGARWHTVVAPYVPPLTTGPQDPALLFPDRLQPMTAGSSTRGTALAVNASSVIGLLARDARWDPACDGTASAKCRHELAWLGLDASGSPTGAAEPVRLTINAWVQVKPAIASLGDGFVAAWIDWADATSVRLLAAAIDPQGELGPVVELARDTDLDAQRAPAIAANADRAVVVWVSSRERAVFAAALTSGGAPSGARQVVDNGAYVVDARIAATPNGFVTAFRRTVDDENGSFDIWTRPLSAEGLPVDIVRRATWATSSVAGLSLASHGAEVGLAWLCGRGNGTDTNAVSTGADQAFATLLDASGHAAAMELQLSADPNPASAIAIGFDGGGWTVLWEQRRSLRQQVYLGRMVCGN